MSHCCVGSLCMTAVLNGHVLLRPLCYIQHRCSCIHRPAGFPVIWRAAQGALVLTVQILRLSGLSGLSSIGASLIACIPYVPFFPQLTTIQVTFAPAIIRLPLPSWSTLSNEGLA